MTILLTEKEVLELAYDYLDMNQPNPDKVHDVALKMDMKYMELMDMYWDVEEHSLRKLVEWLKANAWENGFKTREEWIGLSTSKPKNPYTKD